MTRKYGAIFWIVAFSFAAKNVFAQGCASCYTTAAAGGTQTIHALRDGILVLLVPPALMFVGIMFLAKAWRTQIDASQACPPPCEKQIPGSAPSASECSWNESLRCEGRESLR